METHLEKFVREMMSFCSLAQDWMDDEHFSELSRIMDEFERAEVEQSE